MIDLERITHPLRLASGSHERGSGKGCAMNVISYINGDTQITDYPACSARPLARLVQRINDSLADKDGFLSPENSIVALDFGWQTVGTADVPDAVVWQWLHDILVDPVHGVVQYARPDGQGAIADVAALCRRQALGDIVTDGQWREARDAAYAAYAAALTAAAADAAAYAADAYAAAAADAARIDFTRWAIQHWRDLARLDTPTPVEPADINTALSQIHTHQ